MNPDGSWTCGAKWATHQLKLKRDKKGKREENITFSTGSDSGRELEKISFSSLLLSTI